MYIGLFSCRLLRMQFWLFLGVGWCAPTSSSLALHERCCPFVKMFGRILFVCGPDRASKPKWGKGKKGGGGKELSVSQPYVTQWYRVIHRISGWRSILPSRPASWPVRSPGCPKVFITDLSWMKSDGVARQFFDVRGSFNRFVNGSDSLPCLFVRVKESKSGHKIN